jgi:serine O-acetyltransferase
MDAIGRPWISDTTTQADGSWPRSWLDPGTRRYQSREALNPPGSCLLGSGEDVQSTEVTHDRAEPGTPAPGTDLWLRHCISADLAMHGLQRWRAHYRVTRGVIYFQWLLRRSEYWCHPSRSGVVAWIMGVQLKFRLRRQSERLGFEVPRFACGPGLSIAHPGLLVISAEATIGARCRIHQGVTIGAAEGGAPTIGNDVFIGPNAVLIGPITVGHEAFIYPGAVCSTHVPDRHAAAGVPARVRPHSFEAWRPGRRGNETTRTAGAADDR